MNVLMVGVDESTKGGMWTVVENYLNDSEFVKRNNLVYIPTSITCCPILNKLIFTAKAYLKIIVAYRKTRFDILHVHMSERSSINRKGIVMSYAKKRGTKIVLHMHGAEFEVLYKQMTSEKQKSVRDILNMADKILILGRYWSEFIGSLVDDPSKVVVVYNAVPVPKTYEYNQRSKTILFLGAVSKRKGKEILLEALKKKATVLSKDFNVKIYGPDVDANIVRLIEENGLSSWVKYCGWLGKDEKAGVLKTTAINVLPSYNEGLPMTILEAMSYGIPSITTSVAAIPEAVNSENGVVVTPGSVDELADALEKICIDEKHRFELSKRAYEDAVNIFSVEKHIAQIQSIYEEIIK